MYFKKKDMKVLTKEQKTALMLKARNLAAIRKIKVITYSTINEKLSDIENVSLILKMNKGLTTIN